jgi:asparagine synthase (glutamine-hydrolysing)
MCGLSGLCALTGPLIDPAEITAQIGTMVHRGPNEGAVFVSPRRQCGLGIRRLSIIDVAAGHQPLINETGAVHLVCNGEIYNHRSLRRQLTEAGHTPHTHSDAEAILHGYEQWGVAGMLAELRGMFAFALWDDPRRRLLLARDRFGIKPLYYALHAGRLCFASEIRAILAAPDFPRRVNLPALQAMLTIGFVPGPATIFEGVFQLPPAHFLLAENGGYRLEKYWQLDGQPDPTLREADAVAQFRALLTEAVDMRLMSEVPLGALLSGGLDSGMLVALMQAGLSRPLQTVSLGFETADYDESASARLLADALGTTHHAVNFTDADFTDYPAVLAHLETPQGAATALPIYRLYRACREAGLTVVLTGEGADELLGGYHWHRGDALVRRLLFLPAPLRRWIAASPMPMSAAARRVLTRAAPDIATRYRDWLELPGENHRTDLLAAEVQAVLPPAADNPLLSIWAEALTGVKSESTLRQMLRLESQTRLVDFINLEVDKMSMAHSIEARVPFLDHKLWEFCATLPDHFKLRGGAEKYLLRQAAISLLPEPTRTRRKQGLAAPYARWLQSPRLPEWAETALSAGEVRAVGLFNPATVPRLRQAHRAGQPHLGPLLMGVLSTQLWYRQQMG